MKNTKTFVLLASIAALTGCQHAHKPAPVAQASPAETENLAPSTGPTTVAVATAPVLAPSAAAGPATTPVAATAPADAGPHVYVAADADDATLRRNWKPSVNFYPSGHAIAGPVYRMIPPPPRSNSLDDVVTVDLFDTVLAIAGQVGTPIGMLIVPPWTPVEYHGEQFPPSYTVNDPLPYYVDEKVPGIIQMKREK
ncbi:MAG TPA: hypothetical protein VH475_05585 [Tepidisphaeraceae bacterium]